MTNEPKLQLLATVEQDRPERPWTVHAKECGLDDEVFEASEAVVYMDALEAEIARLREEVARDTWIIVKDQMPEKEDLPVLGPRDMALYLANGLASSSSPTIRARCAGGEMKIIECPSCNDPCGKEYPADHTDPSFRKGKGEDFAMKDGRWCCSQFCLDVMNGKFDDDEDPVNESNVAKQCVCGHRWMSDTIRDEQCPSCNRVEDPTAPNPERIEG